MSLPLAQRGLLVLCHITARGSGTGGTTQEIQYCQNVSLTATVQEETVQLTHRYHFVKNDRFANVANLVLARDTRHTGPLRTRICTASCSASISCKTYGLGSIRNLSVSPVPAREPVSPFHLPQTQFARARRVSMTDGTDQRVCTANEWSTIPSLQPESTTKQVQIQCSFFRESQLCHRIVHLEFPTCLRQTVNRHNRESNIAHLKIEPFARVQQCCTARPSRHDAPWSGSHQGTFGYQSRGQPVTAAPESINKKTERNHETSALHPHAAWPVQWADASAGRVFLSMNCPS